MPRVIGVNRDIGGGLQKLPGGSNLSGTIDSGVLVEGLAIVNGDLTVNGDVTVTGSFINSGGHSVNITGDCRISGSMLFDPSAGTSMNPVRIGGNLFVEGQDQQVLPFASGVQFGFGSTTSFFANDDLEALGVQVGDTLTFTSGANSGQSSQIQFLFGFDVTLSPALPNPIVDGDQFTVDLNDIASIRMRPDIDSTTLTVNGDVLAGTLSGAAKTDGVNGLSIALGGNYFGRPTVPGLTQIDISGQGTGNGGTMNVEGTVHSTSIISRGGTNDEFTPGLPGGNGGNLTLGGFSSASRKDDSISNNPRLETVHFIDVKGGDCRFSVGDPNQSGGNGGTVDIRGDCKVEDITTIGGNSQSSSEGNGGNGGDVLIGGDLLLSNNVDANGGSAHFQAVTGPGGKGGDILITGNVTGNSFQSGGNLRSFGGSGGGAGPGGDAGSVRVFGDFSNDGISASGGSGGSTGAGGNGGRIQVVGSMRITFTSCTGGSAGSAGNGNGGDGGSWTVEGPARIFNVDTGGGQARNSGSGGNAGALNCFAFVHVSSNLRAEGGRNSDGTGPKGSGHQVVLSGGGIVASSVRSQDGSQGTGTPSQIQGFFFNGFVHVDRIIVTNRSNSRIEPQNTPCTLRVLEFAERNILNNHSGGSATGAVTSPQNRLFSYDPNISDWTEYVGSGI